MYTFKHIYTYIYKNIYVCEYIVVLKIAVVYETMYLKIYTYLFGMTAQKVIYVKIQIGDIHFFF